MDSSSGVYAVVEEELLLWVVVGTGRLDTNNSGVESSLKLVALVGSVSIWLILGLAFAGRSCSMGGIVASGRRCDWACLLGRLVLGGTGSGNILGAATADNIGR